MYLPLFAGMDRRRSGTNSYYYLRNVIEFVAPETGYDQ
jgi:hypothetical protein